MDSDFILNALRTRYPADKYAFFKELRIGGGFGKDSENRFDAWAICYYPSKRNVTTCFEVKVSRSDFLAEIRNPKKRRPGLRLSQEFYFVTPEGMLQVTDIPPECGLLEITETGIVRTAVHAPFRDIEPPTWLFMASVCRREIAKESVANPEKMFWENLVRDFKTAVNKIITRSAYEWQNKGDPTIYSVVNKISNEVQDLDIQKMIEDRK